MPKEHQSRTKGLHHPLPSPRARQADAIRHAEKLRRALAVAIRRSQSISGFLSEVLRRGEVFEGVEGLDMDVSVLAFPDTRSGPSRSFGFTWEWIGENDEQLMAKELMAQVGEAIVGGELPQEASEFLTR